MGNNLKCLFLSGFILSSFMFERSQGFTSSAFGNVGRPAFLPPSPLGGSDTIIITPPRTNPRNQNLLGVGQVYQEDQHQHTAFLPPAMRRETEPSIIVTDDHPKTDSPLELFYSEHLERWYLESLAMKCPFLRRRKLDLIEQVESVVRGFIQQEGRPLPAKLSCRGNKKTWTKNKGISIEEIVETIRTDWKVDNMKGYYITGRLNTTIYRDDCLFDGPDPDMPVKGLIKYLQVASQLFDASVSRAELLSLEADHRELLKSVGNGNDHSGLRAIHAKWRINAVMRLPWRPKLPEVEGTTTYYLDEDGLIETHTETWDNISVLEAFKSLCPKMDYIKSLFA